MSPLKALKREYVLWRRYPGDRVRWLVRHRHSPLKDKTFMFGPEHFPYFIHPYNHTWLNERAVEIPVVCRLVRDVPDQDLLEIGNVLSHYLDHRHVVVDKYEHGAFQAVVNRDIVDLDTDRKYRLVVSISTLEHVGWHETPRTPEKVLRAFDKINALLLPGGRAIITVPVGQNAFLDQCLRERRIPGFDLRSLKRISAANEWEPVDPDTALRCSYGSPFPNANAVIFMTTPPSRTPGGPS